MRLARRWQAVAGVLVLLLALGGALLSRGVADAAAHFRQQQAGWEQGLAPHAPLGAGAAERLGQELLGIRGRSRVQDAYVAYTQRLWFMSSSALFRRTEVRSDAIDSLAALRGSLARPSDRSRLDVTLCVLSAVNSSASGSQRGYLLRSAVGFCADAVREEPANAEAKYDLELLLSQSKKGQAAGGRGNRGGRRPKAPNNRRAATPHTQLERRVGY